MEELLEHLRGRFDEVALDVEAAGAGEAVLAADHMVHQVAELVQEDHDVAVLHQARVAGYAAGEVADQRALGQLPARAPVVIELVENHLSLPSRGCMSR